jgi:inosine-uridine nucleoside N-ribohydrolase
MDFNVQWDTRAADVVAATGQLTLVTLPATLTAYLCGADLPRLRAAGPLGQLLARQGEAHGQANEMEKLGREHSGLPDDLLDFHYDPVACAVALGWPGATIKEMRLRPVLRHGVRTYQAHPEGRPTRVVLEVDGAAFRETWLSAVENAARDTS